MINADSSALGERKVALWIARAISYFVYFYLIVVEIILFIGFFLLLFGANPSAGFTQWAYRNLDRVMDPFRGIFSPIELGTTGTDVQATFDTSVLFAMIIYGIVALLLSGLIGWLSGRLHQIDNAEAELQRRAEYDARMNAIAEQQAAATAQAAAAAGQTGVGTVSAPPSGSVPPSPRTAPGAAPGTTPGVQASPPHDL